MNQTQIFKEPYEFTGSAAKVDVKFDSTGISGQEVEHTGNGVSVGCQTIAQHKAVKAPAQKDAKKPAQANAQHHAVQNGKHHAKPTPR